MYTLVILFCLTGAHPTCSLAQQPDLPSATACREWHAQADKWAKTHGRKIVSAVCHRADWLSA